MKLIPLSIRGKYAGKFAMVDDEDFEYLNQWRWYLFNCKTVFYAARSTSAKKEGKKVPIIMHRLIMNCPPDMIVDHRDHDGLNNQRSNLRICTKQQNACNRVASRGVTSKFIGVSRYSENKWQAALAPHGKPIHLGYFNSEIEAAAAYDASAKKHYGEFASQNIK